MNNPKSPTPETHLRDARLQQALVHAPDAQEMPAASTRIAIKIIATSAIQTSRNGQKIPEKTWWQRLWDDLGKPRSPWNVALATVLLGGIITLLWHGYEIPDAAPDRAPPVAEAAPAALPPAPPPSAAPVVLSASPVADSAAPRRLAKAKAPEVTIASTTERPATADRMVAEQTAKDAPGPASAEAKVATAPSATVAVAPPAPVGAPVTAPAAPAARPAPAPAVAMRAAKSPATPTWASAALQMNDKAVTLGEEQIGKLAQALTTLLGLSQQAVGAVPTAQPTLHLTLRSAGGDSAVLELWPEVLRWQSAGQATQIRTVEAASAQALLAEAARLLPP